MSKPYSKRKAGRSTFEGGRFHSCYLAADVYAFIEQYAREQGRTRSWVARQLVKRGLPSVRALEVEPRQ